MATTISSNLLGALRQRIITVAAYGQYKIGSAWHNAEIESGYVRANGSVCVSFIVEPQDAALTPATQFRLCDEDGNVLAEREDTIAFIQNAADALLCRFRFSVKAGEDE